MKVVPVIISGGAGSRLWPASRQSHPKPFLKVADGHSLIQHTVLRAASIEGVVELVAVTSGDHLFLTKDDFDELDSVVLPRTFLLEPEGRDTAAAVAAATVHAKATQGPDAILCVFPADHMIGNLPAFLNVMGRAIDYAKLGRIATLGINPTRPDTAFGYIEADGEKVVRFVEKPDLETAQAYLASKRFFWNAGIFCFSAQTMLNEMALHCPAVIEAVSRSYENARFSDGEGFAKIELAPEHFGSAPRISLDHAVMEKAGNLAVIPCDMDWNDIGSWNAMAELIAPDENGNRIRGDIHMIGTAGSYISSDRRVIGTVGVNDLIIVDSPDALLVASRDRVQDVKKLFEGLKASGHGAHLLHSTVHRPWGTYTVLEEGERFKIKRIEVKPGRRLSLQMHYHRSEHWVVVSGSAKIVNGDQELFLATNESTYIPCGHKHRLENPGRIDLVIIEVQSGDYLGEDDIVRFDDVYGRA
ncbi:MULTISPECIES: mannose-1-phosphate guanylyltransferase/mannose-6-phosphate isomerase [Mesorhizobium]|uniref:mannose-1-phosphate guanylyltransferase n=1 Tax=Rhizobium loti TaxID=381 RepID=A0A6M7U5H7_RHILI|nr:MULTISPECIES: mannose-1-phosphate guanylyltransferase/mannose-6-phosphate isomerase [Mesorhizobium]KRB32096.1 mannose-1-phosphate guanyltransferase [Mesorhizobium sp. Root172]OBQ71865.1 mannose-1-phosphate guanylyltransferase/mannose-6-phosphate isomerase [Mesorhizobium loti]QKC72554.1 mannose-1-phosphate guanylyltransferase/mannose-6-phosphate isomerase [Mesorhizobium loti]QKC91416.1 mannose-1-phosphate guanylyltransferase/mannose-6-phosphate isomerase [Mesorhizobium sp. NZP2234]